MPNISALVQQISNALVSVITASGNLPLTPLPDGSAGRILLGKQHDYEHTDAPRVIFTPKSSSFGAKDVSMGPFTALGKHPPFEKVIGTDSVTFEVRCWGRGVSDATHGGTDPDADYDATQALYQGVLAVVDDIALGSYDFGDGDWTDDVKNVRRGREFVFSVTIHTPVYARLPLATTTSPVPAGQNPPPNYANPQVTNHGGTVVTLTNPAGTSGSENI